jgi:hypothetical protein
MDMGPMSWASSVTGWGAGHPERSLAVARSDKYDFNVERRVAFEKAHPEIEILSPYANEIVPLWVAQWRYESDIPEGQKQIIYRSDDLGMLMDYLDRMFPGGDPE